MLPDKGKLPYDIPRNPNLTYKDKDWKGFADWLVALKNDEL
jgi:hypothetical protein